MEVEGSGKVVLSGFNLDPEEMIAVNNVVKNYSDKMNHKIGFKELRLRLKKSLHGKAFLHEIRGTLITDKQYKSTVTDYNLYAVIAEVLEKLMHEAEHNERTNRQKK